MTIEKAKIPAKLLKIEANSQLVAQAVRVYLSNQRSAHAKTKTRGEVNKTTAKMYKQKGTGRARHGAYSAPIFVGGGVAFGPTGEQNYHKGLSKSQNRLAMISALGLKSKVVWTMTEFEKIKGTKEANKELVKSELAGKKTLLVLGAKELKYGKMFRNLAQVEVANSLDVNTYQIMKSQQLLFTEAAFEEVVKKYVD